MGFENLGGQDYLGDDSYDSDEYSSSEDEEAKKRRMNQRMPRKLHGTTGIKSSLGRSTCGPHWRWFGGRFGFWFWFIQATPIMIMTIHPSARWTMSNELQSKLSRARSERMSIASFDDGESMDMVCLLWLERAGNYKYYTMQPTSVNDWCSRVRLPVWTGLDERGLQIVSDFVNVT
jgi:hypothetical protein